MIRNRRGEYYLIQVNGTEKTVLMFRDEEEFDKEMNKTNAKKWYTCINRLIIDTFNTDEWEYLGEMETYHPVRETKILYVTIEEYM